MHTHNYASSDSGLAGLLDNLQGQGREIVHIERLGDRQFASQDSTWIVFSRDAAPTEPVHGFTSVPTAPAAPTFTVTIDQGQFEAGYAAGMQTAAL